MVESGAGRRVVQRGAARLRLARAACKSSTVQAELKSAMTMMGMQSSDSAIANMISTSDKDKDGLVDLNEFLTLMGAK